MILYIAGPMTGYADFNYPAFRAAETQLVAAGHEVLNPVDSEKHNTTGKPQTWDWYMRHALRMVIQAEGIALLPFWEQSRGARLEHTVAEALNLDIRDLSQWLEVASVSAVEAALGVLSTIPHALTPTQLSLLSPPCQGVSSAGTRSGGAR